MKVKCAYLPNKAKYLQVRSTTKENKRTDRKHVTQIEIDENVQVNNLFK